MSSLVKDLQQRGLIADLTSDQTSILLEEKSRVFYAGFDPSSSSLHIGNLVPLALMRRLQQGGHHPIALIGGATGMIGDPSGKSDERPLLSTEALQINSESITNQICHLLDSTSNNPVDIVNNQEWFTPLTYLTFLRDVGKHLTVNYMMAKDSVRTRLENRSQGISYTEFSYMMLQAFDFVTLAQQKNCQVQIGGTDQWGNITAGIELQRKIGGTLDLYGITCPLLTHASGEKMGKTTAGNHIWLDNQRTSVYRFYQYWLTINDDDLLRFLLLFSSQSITEIKQIIEDHQQHPEQHQGQKTLAKTMTEWVHGTTATDQVIKASRIMFGAPIENLSDNDLMPLLEDIPSSTRSYDALKQGLNLLEILVETQLVASKSAGRRLITSGGIYINNQRSTDPDTIITTEALATETMIILRSGKKNYHILAFNQ